ncbi:substrate-binding periplasmic protein [Aestuariirhabdus sp. LZHN29]|uniref:substrate-binding periplasmic protein n=1 Tax=Aestuariirhabdus sp. LZHN29 TaxID=3417462 RepID=UPI003CE6C739
MNARKNLKGRTGLCGTLRTLVWALLLFPALAHPDDKTITFVADEWAPFNGVPNSEMEGYMVDVARAVFEPQGYKVIYRNLPWTRAVAETREGHYNAVIGASRSDAQGFVFPEEELNRNRLSFYVKKDSDWKFTGIDSLNSVRIGVVAGYDYRDWFREFMAKKPSNIATIHGDRPLERNINKLVLGRIDVVVDTAAAIRWSAKQAGMMDEIISAGDDHIGDVAYIYHAFSPHLPTSQTYADILDEGIRTMRANGELHTILQRYGLQDWK